MILKLTEQHLVQLVERNVHKVTNVQLNEPLQVVALINYENLGPGKN